MKTLYSGVIRNAICLRLQRGWSKLIRILLVSKSFIDEEKKRASKIYNEQLLNTEFAWDNDSLSQAVTIANIPCSIDKGMVRESISKTKKWKGCRTVKCSVRNSKDSRRSRS